MDRYGLFFHYFYINEAGKMSGVCVCVCVCLPLRMLYRLTPSFMCMYDLQCVGFIDLYWTNIKKCSEL